ncbi:P-loop containing nucleoside triphosphate hydrolase protein [Piptocephalis cylindrospora]|uniref:RNA helicase n=1 Tax=Piptocephalis cylindrospora TaxID=1907219 RepID=A0A4P9Y136_9FUNG|nr:P-loop containing nucleoside triphosphate hydrolase protein [Piptocephalis cylindrospora]|eukprot:RKP12463.1 P-loop containing nucleoside triphosphate hydrolase protein [Piptocephalis cylindrospora]
MSSSKDTIQTDWVDNKASFETLELDSRLLRALAKLNFTHPTLVQAKAIPLILQGKDVLARAATGSGKTAAYALPVLEKVLRRKAQQEEEATFSPSSGGASALILVPTRELAAQVTNQLGSLTFYCRKLISVVNVATSTVPALLQGPLLAANPDIIVGTPSRIVEHLSSGTLNLRTSLETLVVDEADLVLSFGYSEDVKSILDYLPRIHQSLLMSATLTQEVDGLKQLMLRNPAILRLEEAEAQAETGEGTGSQLSQYVVNCGEREKFLFLYVILKLQLIRGKILIFVNGIDRCYRVKLFLEQFSIRSCVLNSELPLNSRYHIVEEFNRGVYDYIIATDESDLQQERDSEEKEEEEEEESVETNGVEEVAGEEEEEEEDDKEDDETESEEEDGTEEEQADEANSAPDSKSQVEKKKKKSHRKQDKEYGVSRGVDFVDVAAVVNFDFPASARSYTHRVGRSARGHQKGMSLSFVVPKSEGDKEDRQMRKEKKLRGEELDEVVYARVLEEQASRQREIKPYTFDRKQVEGFQYRMEDALRAVTRVSVREARIKELKSEILHSQRLKTHFEDRPGDLAFLRHDRALHPARVQAHMRNVPKYLMPKITVAGQPAEKERSIGFVPFTKSKNTRKRKTLSAAAKKKQRDPLRTFKARGDGGGGKRPRT